MCLLMSSMLTRSSGRTGRQCLPARVPSMLTRSSGRTGRQCLPARVPNDLHRRGTARRSMPARVGAAEVRAAGRARPRAAAGGVGSIDLRYRAAGGGRRARRSRGPGSDQHQLRTCRGRRHAAHRPARRPVRSPPPGYSFWASVAFLAGSVLGGMAPTLPVLVAARVVQGLGGGGLLVLIQAVIADRSRWRLAGRGFAALAGLLRLVGARAGGHR
jgi:hypothetical protein